MYKLRKATHEDLPLLTEMGLAFHAESGYNERGIPADPESITDYARITLDSGLVVIAEVEETGEPVGMLGTLITPHLLNKHIKVATETAWYIKPEHRRSKLGAGMFQYSRAHAKLSGATHHSMTLLPSSPEGAREFLEASGMDIAEYHYLGPL